MAILKFEFDTGSVTLTRINNALAVYHGYQDIINGAPNPESKAQFVKRIYKLMIINQVRDGEKMVVRAQAEAGVTPIELT